MLLKISDIFFNDNVRFNVCIQFFQIKEKSIFPASEGGKYKRTIKISNALFAAALKVT